MAHHDEEEALFNIPRGASGKFSPREIQDFVEGIVPDASSGDVSAFCISKPAATPAGLVSVCEDPHKDSPTLIYISADNRDCLTQNGSVVVDSLVVDGLLFTVGQVVINIAGNKSEKQRNSRLFVLAGILVQGLEATAAKNSKRGAAKKSGA